jgi:hypothetical protein
MPRDLADVLHHLLPEAGPAEETRSEAEIPRPPQRPARPAPASDPTRTVLALPIGDQDVVRAAFAWNLVVEIARLGVPACVVAPESDRAAGLWPEADLASLGAELRWAPAHSLAELHQAAHEVAGGDGADRRAGVVLVRVPPRWLPRCAAGAALLRWTLLLTSAERSDLVDSYGVARLVRQVAPDARIGVTVHGVHRRGEAPRAFATLAHVIERRLGFALSSYGLLTGDLQVYRAVVARRPVGLVHPQSPAARSLQDVARLLLADARIPTDA